MKWLVVVAALAACNPYLEAESVAPPGRTARLDEVNGFWGLQRYRLELSEGVAFAAICARSGPCEHMSIVSDDPAIAWVRPASLATLTRWLGGAQQAAALVVVGKAPGTTTVHVSARQGHRDIVVTVVPAPGAATARTAVR